MKKLMTMIAAIAAGVMAYGDTTYASTGFEDPSEFAEGVLATGGETGWSTTDTGATLTKGVYDGDAYTGTRNPAFAADENANYLNVKTAFGKPLERALEVTVGDDSVYFDQLVKMTAVDEPPSVDGYGAKIVIYAQDMTEAETPSDVTNLYAVAGRYVNGELSTDTYCLGAIDITQWHRLTIKTIKAYNNSAVAFEVFVDGVARAYTENKAYDSASGLTTAAQALNAAKKLLPSMVAAATIAAVGFDGQGAIDDLVATTALPGDWAQDKNITLAFDAHVTSVTYTAHGEQTTATDSPVVIPWASDMTVTLNNVVYAQNWAFDKITGTGFSVNDNVISVTADNAAIMINSKDVTPRMAIEINGEAAGTAPSFAAALATINALPSGTAKITLNENITLSIEKKVTEATITSGAAVEIDLAGKTITGPAGYKYGVIESTAALKISDSVGTGKVMLASGNTAAVTVDGNMLTVTGGTFEGPVVAATSLVSGGKFLKGEEEAFALTLADGYRVAGPVDGYWVVSAIPEQTLTVTTNANATYILTINGVETAVPAEGVSVREGAAIVLTATANTGYEYAESANVVSTTMPAEALNITVPAPTAIKWTITYLTQDEEEFATDTYTIENRATKELNAGTRDGYDFVKWMDYDTGDDVTSLAEMTGDITLVGEWTEKKSTYTITVTGGVADKTSYQISDVDQPVTLKADNAPAGKKFKQWNLTAPDGVSIEGNTLTIPAGTVGNIEVAAEFEDVTVDPEKPMAYDTAEKATAAAAEINANKATYINAPAGVDKAAYVAHFEAVAEGTEVTVKLTAAAAADLQDNVNANVINKVKPAEIAAGTATNVELTTVPGFYYSVKSGNGIGTMTEGTRVLATGATLTLDLPKFSGAGFYQIMVNVKDK